MPAPVHRKERAREREREREREGEREIVTFKNVNEECPS